MSPFLLELSPGSIGICSWLLRLVRIINCVYALLDITHFALDIDEAESETGAGGGRHHGPGDDGKSRRMS